MELGFKTAPHHIDWTLMSEIWQFADESNVYTQGWNFDHFYAIQGDTEGPCLEAWVTLTALAAQTSRIRIGTMVNGVVYRHPAVLAAMASSLDIVSGGRLELGLGAGWNEQECNAYGIELGSIPQRMDRFDEAVEVVVRLLSEEYVNFSGEFFQLENARNEPKGPQQPLPICIGGLGERRTLRTVARFAHHWNLSNFTPELFTQKHGALERHCESLGRDVSEIKVSSHLRVNGDFSSGDLITELNAQADAGIDQAVLYFQPPIDMATVEAVTLLLEKEFDGASMPD